MFHKKNKQEFFKLETELNELERKRLHIQYCDLYAHDRKYIEQRRNYIGQMTRKLELK